MLAAYERLTALTLVIIEQGIGRGFLAHCNKVVKCVREYIRADWHKTQLDLKLRMLASKAWRERVLKDLGGEAALQRWDKRMSRYRVALYLRAMGQPDKSGASTETVWRKTPDRIAKELRQIAHGQKCAKAAAHPLIFRDPIQVDDEGQFRLAPVPRLKGKRRFAEEVLATDPYYMERYEYDAMRVAKMTGFDAPVAIYPAEFRAAAMLEVGDGERNSQPCHTDANEVRPVPMPETCVHREIRFSLKQSGMDPGHRFTVRRDDKVETSIANDQPP